MGLIEDLEGTRLGRTAYWAIIMAFVVTVLITGKQLLIPFVIALVIGYIILALYDWIGRLTIKGGKLPKWLRASLALIIIMVLFMAMGEILTYNIDLMIAAWPQYQANSRVLLQEFQGVLGMENMEAYLRTRLQDFDVRPMLTSGVSSATSAIGNFFIIIIYVIFLLLENATFDHKLRAIHRGDPHNYVRLIELLTAINTSISNYLVLKTIVSFITAILSYLILILIGVDFPVFWAFLILVLNFIPNVGSLIATIFPAIISLLQFGSFGPFLLVLAGVGSVQLAVGNFIEPKIMGTSLNLSPLVVVLSLTFWGYIWGIVGMVLAVPIMVIVVIILAQFPSTRVIAILLSEKGVVGDLHTRESKK